MLTASSATAESRRPSKATHIESTDHRVQPWNHLTTTDMYNYQTEKPKLFTEDGQVMFLRVRDQVKTLLNTAGAVRAQEALKNASGDSWMMLACLDRLVELREIRELPNAKAPAQHRVFVAVG